MIARLVCGRFRLVVTMIQGELCAAVMDDSSRMFEQVWCPVAREDLVKLHDRIGELLTEHTRWCLLPRPH